MMKLSLLVLLQASSCVAFAPLAPGRSQLSAPSQRNGARSPSSSSSLSAAEEDGGGGFGSLLQGIFSPKSAASSVAQPPPAPRIPDVVIDTDYTLAAAFAVAGISIVALNQGVGGVVGGGFVTLLASLFAVQATRLRFVFDEDCFELMSVESVGSDDLRDSGENIVVGGANRWAYSSFVNWDFYPSLEFPVLVYFKETQTPSKEDGGEPGQIHFFPAIANCQQLKEQFELRGCASVERS